MSGLIVGWDSKLSFNLAMFGFGFICCHRFFVLSTSLLGLSKQALCCNLTYTLPRLVKSDTFASVMHRSNLR